MMMTPDTKALHYILSIYAMPSPDDGIEPNPRSAKPVKRKKESAPRHPLPCRVYSGKETSTHAQHVP
jgi:hypothetical protein